MKQRNSTVLWIMFHKPFNKRFTALIKILYTPKRMNMKRLALDLNHIKCITPTQYSVVSCNSIIWYAYVKSGNRRTSSARCGDGVPGCTYSACQRQPESVSENHQRRTKKITFRDEWTTWTTGNCNFRRATRRRPVDKWAVKRMIEAPKVDVRPIEIMTARRYGRGRGRGGRRKTSNKTTTT